MTKNNKYLTFYLGAGASYNALPIVNEFPFRLQYFIDYLVKNLGIGRGTSFVQNLIDLKSQIEQHSTFDVYAKKLFLQKRIEDLEKFKFLISVFLTFEQIVKEQEPKFLNDKSPEGEDVKKQWDSIKRAHSRLDKRYDSLFALLMNQKDGEIHLDTNVRFISWNYDIQLELSMLNFYRNENNNLQDDFDKLPKNSIIKLNGDGNILKNKANDIINLYVESKNSFDKKFISQIIDWFDPLEYKSQIKFAWELDLNQDATDIVKNSAYLVSIGYSFPNFNRSIDQFVFKEIDLKKCKTYIQDLNPQQIVQNIEWIDDTIGSKKFNINSRNQVSDFFVPPSFNINPSVKESLEKSNKDLKGAIVGHAFN